MSIEVRKLLQDVGGFERFCSVERLRGFVESLAGVAGFEIEEAGRSEGGRPIHHVRYGTGSIKALFVGWPDANEPIGGLTVFSLLTLLAQRHPLLVSSDVEWHIIPCIDPDGATLNEAWSQEPFDLQRYLRHFHRPAGRDQIDCSFPVDYKRLAFDTPVTETRVLMRVIERIRADFYYALHNNSGAMGVWLLMSRDIGSRYHGELHGLLADFGMPIQMTAPFGGQLERFAEGIYENVQTRRIYDILERSVPAPEVVMHGGARSCDYVTELNPRALSFISELPCVTHPASGSARPTNEHLREIKLGVDADNKFLGARLLEELSALQGRLDTGSPFYRKAVSDLLSVQDQLHEGLPCWPRKTRDTVYNPRYAKLATEGERYEVYMLERFFVLCHYYEVVRLLRVSGGSREVTDAIGRLEADFARALARLDEAVGLGKFRPFALDDLARVQLGSGLIVLNSLL